MAIRHLRANDRLRAFCGPGNTIAFSEKYVCGQEYIGFGATWLNWSLSNSDWNQTGFGQKCPLCDAFYKTHKDQVDRT